MESRKIVLSWVSLADNGPLIASLRIPDVDATVALPDLGAIDEARREAFDATQHLHDSRIASYFGSPDVTVMGRALYLAGDAPPLCAPDRYGRMQPWPKHQEPGDKELQLRCNYGGTTALILQGDAKLLAQASHEPSPCLVTDNPSVARRIFAGACTLREGDPKTVLRDKFRDITGR